MTMEVCEASVQVAWPMIGLVRYSKASRVSSRVQARREPAVANASSTSTMAASTVSSAASPLEAPFVLEAPLVLAGLPSTCAAAPRCSGSFDKLRMTPSAWSPAAMVCRCQPVERIRLAAVRIRLRKPCRRSHMRSGGIPPRVQAGLAKCHRF